jgi:hypothetical protein
MWTETSPHNFERKIRRKGNTRPEHWENLSTSESRINTNILNLYKKVYTVFSKNIGFI